MRFKRSDTQYQLGFRAPTMYFWQLAFHLSFCHQIVVYSSTKKVSLWLINVFLKLRGNRNSRKLLSRNKIPRLGDCAHTPTHPHTHTQHTHTHTHSEKSSEFLNMTVRGTYSYHLGFKWFSYMFLKNSWAQKEMQLWDVQQKALPLFLRPLIQFSGSQNLAAGSQGICWYISVMVSLKFTF